MRAVLVESFGGPENFAVVEMPEPTAGVGQVLVRVAVSGANYLDVYQRSGSTPLAAPYVAGVEGVGVVTAIGEGVDGIQLGERIGWLGGQGSFADLVAVAADKAVPIPDGVDDVTAVAVLMQGVTAHYLAADAYAVRPGDDILVHAAAGGVGQLLTQIVRMHGGRVLATASTPEKQQVAFELGAHAVFGYDAFADRVREATRGLGVAAVYDGVGATTFDGSLASLQVRGTLVVFGASSGPVPPLDVTRLAAAGSVFVTRPTVVHYTATQEELRRRAVDLFSWVEGGELLVAPPRRFQLDDIAPAFEALESRATSGKLVFQH